MTHNATESLSLDDVRHILSDSIRELREGRTSAAAVNAVSNATGKILSSVKLEMEYYRLTGKTPNIEMMNGNALPQPSNTQESSG